MFPNFRIKPPVCLSKTFWFLTRTLQSKWDTVLAPEDHVSAEEYIEVIFAELSLAVVHRTKVDQTKHIKTFTL